MGTFFIKLMLFFAFAAAVIVIWEVICDEAKRRLFADEPENPTEDEVPSVPLDGSAFRDDQDLDEPEDADLHGVRWGA